MKDWSALFAHRAKGMVASEIRELLKLLDQPDIISFAGGIPDPKLFPTAKLADAFARVLGDPTRAGTALQYSVSEGYLPLRQWLVGYMRTLGVACGPDNILIVNGSQQALDFLGKLFIETDDTVLVARPTYLGALQAFTCYRPRYDVLPERGSNRTVESYLAAGTKPKLGYVMPEFQNPTGTSLDLEERTSLLDAAEALDMVLIEDCAYEKLRYDGERVPSMMELSIVREGGIDNARVVYCGTFSKTIVPALRIGWIVAPQSILQKLVLFKQASDLHVSTLNQIVMHEVAAELIEDHAVEIRKIYRDRRDALLHALKRYMPEGVSWTYPDGGMFVWVTMPCHINAPRLLERAIKETRVAFVPGDAFFDDRSQHHHLRLSFSLNDADKIDVGIKRLAALIEDEAGR